MYKFDFKIPLSVIKLLKIVLRVFYSDLHIITIDILLKLGYVSEFYLTKELKIETEKIRMVTNSLQKENFIKYEDRIFKKLKFFDINKRKKNPKIYKIRFWFIDFDSLILKIKEKIKNIIFNQQKIKKNKEIFNFYCPRKICDKKFFNEELSSLSFNHTTGKFHCNNLLSIKIICGEELKENTKNLGILDMEDLYQEKKLILSELKPIIILILSSFKIF
jgi:transcription initiation factor IIE alpha subunit